MNVATAIPAATNVPQVNPATGTSAANTTVMANAASDNNHPAQPPQQQTTEGDKKASNAAQPPKAADANQVPQANTEGAKTQEAKEGQAKDSGQPKGDDPYKDLALPEKSFLTKEDLEEIKAFAKEKGLSAEQAKLLVERENHAIAGWVGLQKEALEHERKEKWLPALKADPDFGGQKFEEVEGSMKSFFERFDPNGEFQKHLEASGLRYFPPLWKMLARASQAAARDRILPGQPGDVQGTSKRLSNAEVFYGRSSK